jgi:acyl-CoA thioesterase-1
MFKLSSLLFTAYIFLFAVTGYLFGEIKVLVIGDSLTEGYGIDQEYAYPAILEKKLNQELSQPVKVINGGVSGSTSASGYARLQWFKSAKPDILVIALGANDGLRGIPVEETENHFHKMLQELKGWNAKVWIAGMKMPPNYGVAYRKEFEDLFPQMAKEYSVGLIPFLLEGVGGEPEMNLADGIHPNEKGHERMAETVYSYIKRTL